MKNMEFVPSLEPSKEQPAKSFLKDVIGAAALVSAVSSTPLVAQEPQVATIELSTSENKTKLLSTREKVSESERLMLGENFSLEQYTYTTLYQKLTNREVMFTDGRGIIIGDPVRLDPIVDNSGDKPVIIMPGTLDGRGVPTDKIAPAWLNAMRTRLSVTYNVPHNLEASLPRVRSTIRLVRDSERYLTPGMPRPETFFDIIKYMGRRQVQGETSPISHIDYARINFGQNVELPSTLEFELGRMLPGLIAQESQFNDMARSPVGARGMMQIMPDTQKRMGYGSEPLKFQKQVELSGQYFETAFKELSVRNAEDFSNITREFFGGDVELFNKYFLAPVLINSYNAGTTRLSKVVTWFRAQYPTRDSIGLSAQAVESPRYDVYAAMAHKASENTTPETSGYKEHSSEYFSRVFALANIIQQNLAQTPEEGANTATLSKATK